MNTGTMRNIKDKSSSLECHAGLLGITCYGVDADALDREAFRWRQLSVELGLHDLVVPNVPALWFHRHKTSKIRFYEEILFKFSPLTNQFKS